MTFAVPAVFTSNETSGVAKREKLSPGVQREILAISFSGEFEFLRRYPEIAATKLFFIGDVTAFPQEASKIFQVLAFDT
jgi:hypothetical protein